MALLDRCKPGLGGVHSDSARTAKQGMQDSRGNLSATPMAVKPNPTTSGGPMCLSAVINAVEHDPVATGQRSQGRIFLAYEPLPPQRKACAL